MNQRSTLLGALAVLGAAAFACNAPETEATGSTRSAVRLQNGREMNGREMNGREMNGREMNGREMNGRVAGVWYAQRGGAEIDEGTRTSLRTIQLSRGELIAVRADYTTVRGADFKGIYLVGRGPNPEARPVVDPPVAEPTTPREAIRAYVAERVAATDVGERDVPLRVVGAIQTAEVNASHGDVAKPRWHYRVEVKEDDGTWRSFCGNDEDGAERLAIAIPDRFSYAQGVSRATRSPRGPLELPLPTNRTGGALVTSPTVFTFACDNAAIAKCVERLGYDPERTIDEVDRSTPTFAKGKSARGLLESCVRMLRADFCGNGISMTLDGTEVDVFDSPKLHARASDPTADYWKMEASWRPDGASCGRRERQACVPTGDGRWARINVKDYIEEICPDAMNAISSSDDGWCTATHYTEGLAPQPRIGGTTGGGTTGPRRPSSGGPDPTVRADADLLRVRSVWNETDVIFTRTHETGTSACPDAVPLREN